MGHVLSPASLQPIDVARQISDVAARPARPCCQAAVDDAMESTASMGAIASVTMLMVGFTVGITTAWLIFG